MEFLDWRYLLLLAMFGIGWAFARVDMDQVVSKARSVPDLVMAGVRSLLRGDRLEAARNFIDSSQPLSRGNAELHFAAGELFRLQGRHEEAIRVHKDLLACADLDEGSHARARYELGLDYQKSGFLDLAEKCFTQLEGTGRSDAAMRHLLNIHVYSKAWQRAIEDEKRFAANDGNAELRRHVIAQFHCEWAAVEGPGRREELLEQALRYNPSCGRAWLMRAEGALEAGDHAGALKALEVLATSPGLVPVAARLFMRAHAAAGTVDRGEAFLLSAFRDSPTPLMFSKVYDALAEARGAGAMADFVAEAMGEITDPAVAAKWLETERANATGPQRERLDALLRSVGASVGRFSCSVCEFEARSHYWQCPVCLTWEGMLPKVADKGRD